MIKLKLGLLGIFTSMILCASDNNGKALTLTEQQEESLVKSIIPSTKVEKVSRAEADGFYKAYLNNGQILYINPFKRLIFVGEVYTANGQNLTANDRDVWQKNIEDEQLQKVTKEELIKDAVKVNYGQGSKKYEFVIFTDPECPYCKVAEEHFAKNDLTVHINFLPLEMHRNAEKWSLEALSSKDVRKALETIRNTEKDLDIEITTKAKDQLAKMVSISKKYGINGAPKIFVIEKNSSKVVDIINGANINKINEYLTKDKSNEQK